MDQNPQVVIENSQVNRYKNLLVTFQRALNNCFVDIEGSFEKRAAVDVQIGSNVLVLCEAHVVLDVEIEILSVDGLKKEKKVMGNSVNRGEF